MAHESIDLLSRYIRIDTTNPPGREAPAAQFFAEIMDKEGIGYKTYEPEPGRVSLRAVIPGSGEKGPLILLNHMDVVPAEADQWSFDPFGGEVRDGFVCGRGALDMKGQGVMELLAFLDIKRRDVKPDRDLIFLAVADEETGGANGVQYLLEYHPEDLQADLVLNEGGFGVTGLLPAGPVLMISPAEKGVCWLKLTRTGPPGHGSVPHGENALEKMTQALSGFLARETPMTITPIVAEYFKRLGRGWDFLRPYLEDENPETLIRILTESGLLAMPQISAMLKNTTSLTVMSSGIKTNVIPSQVEAHLDNRLLPGQDVDEFIESVKKGLEDDQILIETITTTEASESPIDSEYFLLLEKICGECFPDAVMAPSLLFGTSDSRFFRMKGIPSYGVCPILVSLDDIKMVHGIDEKISVENMIKGTEVFTRIVRGFCTG